VNSDITASVQHYTNAKATTVNKFLKDYIMHKMTMTTFPITMYGHCCRRHVGGQRVVSDISVVRSC